MRRRRALDCLSGALIPCAGSGDPAGTLYAVSNTLDRHYIRRQLPKSSGGVRELSVPDPLLKHIQRQILRVLLVHMPVSPYATAYRYGGSTCAMLRPMWESLCLNAGHPSFF